MTTTQEPYRAACEQVALFTPPDRARIQVTGPEAALFLHNLCTNDIKTLPPSAGREIFLTNAKARVLAHGWVYRVTDSPPAFWLDLAENPGTSVFQHFNRHWVSEQIELTDLTPTTTPFHLAGPSAAALLQSLFGSPVHELAPLHHLQLRPMGLGAVEIFRNDRLGVPGFDLVCAVEQGEHLKQGLLTHGALAAGAETWEVLRIEAGMPRFGSELDEQRPVFEVGRVQQAISYTKGCYLGQEPIVMARDRGHVNRTLLGLKLGQQSVAPRGAKIFRDGQEIGQVTSSVFSPRLGQAVALAYLKRGHQEPGTAVEVEREGERQPGEVAALPFVR